MSINTRELLEIKKGNRGKYRLENNGRNSEDKTINRKNKKKTPTNSELEVSYQLKKLYGLKTDPIGIDG